MNKQELKKRKVNWSMVLFYTVIYLAFFSTGIFCGMAYQQRLTMVLVAEALSYSDIEVNVNFNETKFIEELNKTIVPAFKESFNLTEGEKLK